MKDIIEILNRDENSKKMLTIFEEKAKQAGLTGKEYQENRKTFLMLAIRNNKEAMEAMTEEVYNELTAQPS